MKRLIPLFFTVFFVIFSSCNKQKKQYGDVPQTIIVAGKIDNYDPNQQVNISVKRLGFSQEDLQAKTDNAGNFLVTFESYIPLDVVVGYKTNFWILLHPGDSLYVQFDGKFNNRPELLETIKFSGNRAKTNQFAAKYQQMYFSDEIYYDWDKKQKAVKDYDPDQYLQYMDNLKQKNKEIYEQFVAENYPDDESKKWALLFSENDYYHFLGFYVMDHRRSNNLGYNDPFDVPIGFYGKFTNRLPIDPSMFISAYALISFSDRFDIYVADKLKERDENREDRKIDGGWIDWGVGPYGIVAPISMIDSIVIFSNIEFVHDPLLLQIMLTRHFDRSFEKQNITVYEQFRDIADTYIKEPFLKEPLHQKYLQTKQRIENPQIYTEAVIKEAANLSVNQIVEEILQQNKGKVIYVDFWGTWCGPCLGELPNSKIVEHEFKDEGVVFVYICLESDEKKWKATLDKFQLGGQQYHLSYKQSSEIRTLFEITGVPFYVLIDKNGVIKEKGNHLRPLNVKDKIREMLK